VDDQFVTALKARIVEVTTVSWHFWYGLLLNYVEEYGHAKVPLRFKYEDFNLGGWVGNQKTNYKNDKLDLERIKLLDHYRNGLGMPLKTNGMKELAI